jgi:hypothetical protein
MPVGNCLWMVWLSRRRSSGASRVNTFYEYIRDDVLIRFINTIICLFMTEILIERRTSFFGRRLAN